MYRTFAPGVWDAESDLFRSSDAKCDAVAAVALDFSVFVDAVGELANL